MTFTLSIVQDEDPLNPRLDYDNLGKMICFHKRHNLGDEHNIDPSDFNGWDEMEEHLTKEHDAVIILPLYLRSTTILASPYKQPHSAAHGIQVKSDSFTWIEQPSTTRRLEIRRS